MQIRTRFFENKKGWNRKWEEETQWAIYYA